MNNEAAKIVDSELEVMKVLWSRDGAVPLSELISVLCEKKGWKEPTVKTLVRNLRLKNVIRLAGRGMYAPVVTEREYTEWYMNSVIGKLFGGSAKKLVAALVDDGTLTEEELAELADSLNGR